jgi:hypothetical protein
VTTFLKKIVLFLLGLIVLVSLYLTFLFTRHARPAPNLSNSYSFNEKMEFINKNIKAKQIDVLALGSSMSLNNLHSPTIVKELKTDSYLNTASWGQNMEEDYAMLRLLDKLYQPRAIIITTNFIDFAKSTKTFRYDLLEDYLYARKYPSLYYYLTTFDLSYFAKQSKIAELVRENPDTYEYLGFDKYGGVNLSIAQAKFNARRWDGDSLNAKDGVPVQYQYLDSISNYCVNKNIRLYFLQGPFRHGYWSRIDQQQKDVVLNHIAKVQAQLAHKKGVSFVHTEIEWDDALFADFIHLNATGAQRFTEQCLRQANSLQDTAAQPN